MSLVHNPADYFEGDPQYGLNVEGAKQFRRVTCLWGVSHEYDHETGNHLRETRHFLHATLTSVEEETKKVWSEVLKSNESILVSYPNGDVGITADDVVLFIIGDASGQEAAAMIQHQLDQIDFAEAEGKITNTEHGSC